MALVTRRSLLFQSLALSIAVAAPSARAQSPEATLREHGCLACHTTDGRPGPGPTFAGIYSRSSRVRAGGAVRAVRVDDAYVRRSVREPAAEVVAGFEGARMPRLPVDDAELEAIFDALRALPAVEPPWQCNLPLAIACAAFVLLHLGLSLSPVRSRLIASIGEKWFQLVYSLLITVALAGIVAGWIYREHVPLWDLGLAGKHLPLTLMLLAIYLMVAGYSTKNPASAGMEKMLGEDPRPTGILTVTRHPALWGFVVWAIAHLFANGDVPSLWLFGSVLVLAILGMIHIDARRARSLGPAWTRFAERTSLVPFAAIVRRKTKLDLSGQWWRAGLSIAIYLAIVLWSHELAFGVPAFAR